MSARGARDRRVSLLIQLADQPGALEAALHVFTSHGVNLTHIESRPARGEHFDFYVDCDGDRGDPAIEAVVSDLRALGTRLLVLDDKTVPWFPRQASELDLVAGNVLEAGDSLEADHPGFNDAVYRARRAHLVELARGHRFGEPIPLVDYSEAETATWGAVYRELGTLHSRFACGAYLRVMADMAPGCGYAENNVPQMRDVSGFLEARTGFRIRPVAGLLGARDFLNGLALRVFFATQYVRHPSVPLYTPEPDVCHELIGHAPMLADAAFADFSQELGLASLGASDLEIERLARCYWHSVEFGLVREGGALKAYGAGLLSSFGELQHACAPGRDAAETPEYIDFDPRKAADQEYPITTYQPRYFVARSLEMAKAQMRAYCRQLPRPFYARFNAAAERIWVDRAVRRAAS